MFDSSHLTDDEDVHTNVAPKRTITLSSDDEAQETNGSHKRQRSSSSLPSRPLQVVNKPMSRNTRQTSLSIIKTSHNSAGNEEGKWNLKMIATSSTNNASKNQKKKMTATVDQIILFLPRFLQLYPNQFLYSDKVRGSVCLLEIHSRRKTEIVWSNGSNGFVAVADQTGIRK